MEKLNISTAPILKFLRELSVIVTGIIITVGLGFWVNSVNNQNDLRQNLDAVVIELEENAQKFDLYEKWLQKSVRYGEYIRSNDQNALNPDSLIFYSYSTNLYSDGDGAGCGYYQTNPNVDIFTTNAFEMLKNSGTMRHIKDKELLLSIWDAYKQVETVKHSIENSFQRKQEVAMRDEILLAEGKQVVVPMQIYYKFDSSITIVWACQNASKTLRETVSKLKESKLVKR